MAPAPGVEVEAGTAEAIPSATAALTFDLVVMTHVLEHCADPALAFWNVRALLDPGGGFYCDVPISAALHFQTYSESSKTLDVPRHVHFYSGRSLRRLMKQASLGRSGPELEIPAESHEQARRFGASVAVMADGVADPARQAPVLRELMPDAGIERDLFDAFRRRVAYLV